MRFISTRGHAVAVGLTDALSAGLAPDGGLYVPESLPLLDPAAIGTDADLPSVAARVLKPFFNDTSLDSQLVSIAEASLDLPLPIRPLTDRGASWQIELFHGPTAAFKDFAARFLAECMSRIEAGGSGRTILVATSGDTGAAVAAAFHRRSGFRVVILYPDGRVSPMQAHQLGAFGDNVHTYRVQGNFDDCQRMVKQALTASGPSGRLDLTTANSISIGRLLPQISYYALASLRIGRQTGRSLNVVVPTGNLGNALACILAREIGFPIDEVWLATNANRTLPDFFERGSYQGRSGLETLANAMDVGDPSNFERLAWLFRNRDLRRAGIYAESISDEAIRACIQREFRDSGRIACPHTACALEVLHRIRDNGDDRPFLVAATAHPAKFSETVQPLIDQPIPMPESLAALMRRPSHATPLPPEDAALLKVISRD